MRVTVIQTADSKNPRVFECVILLKLNHRKLINVPNPYTECPREEWKYWFCTHRSNIFHLCNKVNKIFSIILVCVYTCQQISIIKGHLFLKIRLL